MSLTVGIDVGVNEVLVVLELLVCLSIAVGAIRGMGAVWLDGGVVGCDEGGAESDTGEGVIGLDRDR